MIPCFLAVAFSAAEPFVPNFADIPTVEATRVHLHAVGVETFVTEAQKASISPPRIHSKYWVDKAYGLSPSATDAERVAHLFKLYAEKVREGE